MTQQAYAGWLWAVLPFLVASCATKATLHSWWSRSRLCPPAHPKATLPLRMHQGKELVGNGILKKHGKKVRRHYATLQSTLENQHLLSANMCSNGRVLRGHCALPEYTPEENHLRSDLQLPFALGTMGCCFGVAVAGRIPLNWWLLFVL